MPFPISLPWGEQERALIKHRLCTSNDALCFLLGPHLVFRAPPPPQLPARAQRGQALASRHSVTKEQCVHLNTGRSFCSYPGKPPGHFVWLWPTSLALVYVTCHRLPDPSLPTCLDLSQVAPTDPDLQVSGRLVGQGGDTGRGLIVPKASSMDLSEQEKTDTHNKSNSFLDEEPISGPRGSNLGRRNGGPGFKSLGCLLFAV